MGVNALILSDLNCWTWLYDWPTTSIDWYENLEFYD